MYLYTNNTKDNESATNKQANNSNDGKSCVLCRNILSKFPTKILFVFLLSTPEDNKHVV